MQSLVQVPHNSFLVLHRQLANMTEVLYVRIISYMMLFRGKQRNASNLRFVGRMVFIREQLLQ